MICLHAIARVARSEVIVHRAPPVISAPTARQWFYAQRAHSVLRAAAHSQPALSPQTAPQAVARGTSHLPHLCQPQCKLCATQHLDARTSCAALVATMPSRQGVVSLAWQDTVQLKARHLFWPLWPQRLHRHQLQHRSNAIKVRLVDAQRARHVAMSSSIAIVALQHTAKKTNLLQRQLQRQLQLRAAGYFATTAARIVRASLTFHRQPGRIGSVRGFQPTNAAHW